MIKSKKKGTRYALAAALVLAAGTASAQNWSDACRDDGSARVCRATQGMATTVQGLPVDGSARAVVIYTSSTTANTSATLQLRDRLGNLLVTQAITPTNSAVNLVSATFTAPFPFTRIAVSPTQAGNASITTSVFFIQ